MMKIGVHAEDHVTNQRRIIIELTKSAKHAVAIRVASEREMLAPPSTAGESRIGDLILDSAAASYMPMCCRVLLREFHLGSLLTIAGVHHSQKYLAAVRRLRKCLNPTNRQDAWE
jgi:hypothetical protein